MEASHDSNRLVKIDINTDREYYEQVKKLREVFLPDLKENAPLLNQGDDTRDVYVYIVDHDVVGTIRVNKTGEGYKMERVVVRPGMQSKGIGRSMMSEVHSLYTTMLEGDAYIYLHSIHNVVQFYLKCGYKVKGEMFVEADLDHFKMVLGAK